MIRQSITCDICGSEKKQTNHWFVAREQGGELRISGWDSRNRLRPGSRHLCGQTCLHKLVDEFMAKTLSGRTTQAPAKETTMEAHPATASAAANDTSLTSGLVHSYGAPEELDEFESSARLIPTPMPVSPARSPFMMPVELVATQDKQHEKELQESADEHSRFAPRSWQAEAWEREQEREQPAQKRPLGIRLRRLSGSKYK
jgi:hypothetical protein